MVPNKRRQIEISLALILVYMSNVQGFFDSRENRIEIGIRIKAGESEKVKPPTGTSNLNLEKTPIMMKSRILYGETVTPHSMPWQAVLVEPRTTLCVKWPCNKPATLICGAVIICPKFLLSAAHCSYEYYLHRYANGTTEKRLDRLSTPDEQELLIGEHDLANSVGIKYDIKRITVHPKHLKNNPLKQPIQHREHDISIYELFQYINEEMKPSKPNHRPIAQAIHLPHPQDPNLSSGTKMTISGWGLKETGHGTKKLKATNVRLTTIDKCSYNRRTKNIVCTGEGPLTSPGFAPGDSGGPLSWLETKTGKVKLYGIMLHNRFDNTSHQELDLRYGACTKLEPMVMWVNVETGNCNSKTCRKGDNQQRNCMTGAKLDRYTKRKFYETQQVVSGE